jgi:hypothetical protein
MILSNFLLPTPRLIKVVHLKLARMAWEGDFLLWLLCLLDSQLSDADQKSLFAGKALSDNVPVWEIMIPVINYVDCYRFSC